MQESIPQQDAPVSSEEIAPPYIGSQHEDLSTSAPINPDPLDYEVFGNGVENYGEQGWQGVNGHQHGELEQEHTGIMVKEDG